MPTKQQLKILLQDPDFRRQFVADYVQEAVATQIRTMRERLNLTQEQIGEAAAGMSQNQVSRLENPDYSGATVNSLKRIAQAFDVGLIVRLAPFSEFVDWISSMGPERFVPVSYTEEQALSQWRRETEDILGLADASSVLLADSTYLASGPRRGAMSMAASASGSLSYGEWIEEKVTDRALQSLQQGGTGQGGKESALAA